jgi:transcriptional regulator with XRE-family HTH domain
MVIPQNSVNAIFILHFFVGRIKCGMPKKSGLVNQREKEIGQRVQLARERINWPQPAFAAELDISRDRLASIEYARTPLRYPVGYRLCVLFDINPEWLANGDGEMASSLALPELPMPEGLPPKAMFSRIYDQFAASKPGSAKKNLSRRGGGKQTDGDLIPDFDPALHVIRGLTDLFSKETFRSPLERQEFALEITSYARELALRLRRDATKKRALAVSGRRGGSRHADLAGIPAKNAGMVLQLRDGIRRLDQEIGKLDAAMKSLNPVAIDPSRLPRPSTLEVVRLEDAMEKIAQQIEEAERKIKSLMIRRTSAAG